MRISLILKNNKVLLENFSYLSILQVFTIASPLITYPYLLRLLGLDLYGTIIFAQAIVNYIAILINYGFNLSGTQAIAVNTKENKTVNEVVSSIYTIKTIIWIFCFFVYYFMIFKINYFENYRTLFLVSYFITINDVLLPVWFFQGIEKMKYMTFINICSRLLFIILIFILVRSADDYILVPILNSIGALFGGLTALYLVFKVHKVKFKIPQKVMLKKYFSASTPFFISSLSVNIYSNLSRIIVGSFLGMRDVSIYDMAEKVTSLLKIPGALISQACFPRVCKIKSLRFVNRLMFISVGIVFVLYFISFTFSQKIVLLLAGQNVPNASSIIRILTLTSICAIFNSFFGSNRLVVWGYKNAYMKIAMSGCLIYLILFFILFLGNYISLYSITFLPLVSEILIVLIYIYVANQYNLLKPVIKI